MEAEPRKIYDGILAFVTENLPEVEGCPPQDERPRLQILCRIRHWKCQEQTYAPRTMRSKVVAPREVRVWFGSHIFHHWQRRTVPLRGSIWTGKLRTHEHQLCFASDGCEDSEGFNKVSIITKARVNDSIAIVSGAEFEEIHPREGWRRVRGDWPRDHQEH